MMTDTVHELKSKEYAFVDFRDRFQEFWSTFQNVISMESTRFLGNVIQLDPGKKSESEIHFNLFNHSLVLSYSQASPENEYRCILLLEAILPEGRKIYIDHCYFDQKGNIYSALEDQEPQIKLTHESFALILVHEAAEKLTSFYTSKAKELDESEQSEPEPSSNQEE
jgi:hypothetical protein